MNKTIAQLRAEEVKKIVTFKTANPTAEDYREAKRNMTSFYRLCGLSERNLYLANNEGTANRASTKSSEEREYNWYKRLDEIFYNTYGLNLVYCGYMPSIGITNKTGGFSEKICRYFYG